MTKFETAIIKRIDIFLKMFSNFLVIKTIESKTVKTLTDKQLETITPVATDKLKTIKLHQSFIKNKTKWIYLKKYLVMNIRGFVAVKVANF